MKKQIYIVIGIAITLAIIVFTTIIYLTVDRPSNKSIISDEDIFIEVLKYDKIIELPSLNENEVGFTCTGLTYDSKRDTFWIGNYGKINPSSNNSTPSIVQVSKDFRTIVSQINICDDGVDIQGVSYDEITDTLWYSNGKYIINCSVDGKKLKQIDIGEYKKYKPNGVLFDSQTNSIWILCFYNYILNFDTEGNIIKCFQSDYIGQDHLCFTENKKICFSTGNDYQGYGNYVVVCSPETIEIEYAYQMLGSYSIEGISIVDSVIYVANDGYYHEAKIDKNYIAVYSTNN